MPQLTCKFMQQQQNYEPNQKGMNWYFTDCRDEQVRKQQQDLELALFGGVFALVTIAHMGYITWNKNQLLKASQKELVEENRALAKLDRAEANEIAEIMSSADNLLFTPITPTPEEILHTTSANLLFGEAKPIVVKETVADSNINLEAITSASRCTIF